MNTRKRRTNYQQRFDNYLQQYRTRTRSRSLALTFAAILFVAVVITLFTAVLGDTLAYSSWLYYPARILLAIAVIAIVFMLYIKPRKKLDIADGAVEIEAAVPSLGGRAETYLDMKRRNDRSPFLSLLARDASRKTAASPMAKLLPTSEIIGPVIAGGAMVLLLGWLFTAMPVQWRAGMQHLWLGWFKQDILPERTIAIEPGDTKLRLGDSLPVVAWLNGFDSKTAQLHIRKQSQSSGDGEWETIEMNRREEGSFTFTMYGISEPFDYYVSSAFTKSDEASVEVVIPARIEKLQLTYQYPAWTNREPRVVNNGRNVAAVAGTTVELYIETNKPLTDGELLLDQVAGKLTVLDELTYSTSFTIEPTNSTYQIADLLGDDRIMLSDEYTIETTEDASPTISFTRPGGDHNATAIEEVTVIATAADDYAVTEILLHYSLNGGEWMTVPLQEQDNFSHVFMLEEFKTEFNEPLIPGDLVTYYAEAKDREQSTATDIQFIDIRPFERRYTQSQQAGGGGGGGGQQEPPPGEISQRQREILVATWNLIKTQESLPANTKGSGAFPARGLPRRNTPQQTMLEENAALLADLQTKLADQAQKLAERAEARQLLENDPKIAQFVEYMEKAADAMRPSADDLGSQSLQEAVRHQQRALQFLRRGELLFNDITINQSQNSGQGSSAGRDMAEIYELEMDLAKNQYETPDQVQQRSNDSSPEDDALNKLKDLAKRQQQLAEAARDRELSMAEQWEQEKLRRELEELQRELQQLQRNPEQQSNESQTAQNQSGQNQSGQSQSSQGQSSDGQSEQNQSGENQAGNQGGQQSQGSQQQAMQNLEQAIRDLQNSDGEMSDEQRQQALDSASERLQQSLQQMQQARQQRLQDQLADAADNIRDLTEQQEDTAETLRDALQRSIEARNRNEFSSGLTPQQQTELAEIKRQMQRDLEDIKEQLADAAKRFEEDAPDTSEKLQQALDRLDATKASEMMGIAGDLIEDGLAPQAALRERRVSEALENLQQDLFDARESAVAESETRAPQTLTATDAARELQNMRQALNRALQESRNAQNGANQTGTPGSEPDQQANRQSGQNGSQAGQQSGGSQSASSEQTGSQTGNGAGDGSGGQPIGRGQNRGTLSEATQLNGGQQQLLNELTTQLEQLSNGDVEGLSLDTLADIGEFADSLRQSDGNTENDRIIEAEVKLLLRQLEQLELQVYRESQGITGIRSARSSKPAAGFDKRTAEYFKRLSEEASGS